MKTLSYFQIALLAIALISASAQETTKNHLRQRTLQEADVVVDIFKSLNNLDSLTTAGATETPAMEEEIGEFTKIVIRLLKLVDLLASLISG